MEYLDRGEIMRMLSETNTLKQTPLEVGIVLYGMNPTVKDPEWEKFVSFLKTQGVTQEHLDALYKKQNNL